MTIPYCVQVGDPVKPQDIDCIQETIASLFFDIHTIYNDWNPQSEVSMINRLPAFQKVKLSSELFSFLEQIDSYVKSTQGRFDPTVAPLSRCWKTHLNQNQLPPKELTEALVPVVGWDKIHLESGYLWKEHDQTELDLGGVAKGFAIDCLVKKLKDSGFNSLYVEWGGEIRTLGHHPDKRPWKIGLPNQTTLCLNNCAIATSGTDKQQWQVEDKNYTHLIDPKSKVPLKDHPFTHVSVVAPTCMEADALATALMLFSNPEEALSFAKEQKIEAYINIDK